MILTSHKINQMNINMHIEKSGRGKAYQQKKDAQAFDQLVSKFLKR